MVSVYVFVPIYIKILGIDAYGLIAFNAVALALLFIADAGLSSSFAREAAKGKSAEELLDVLVSIERVLFAIVAAAGLLFACLAPLIADRWLSSAGTLPRMTVVQCLCLMPLSLVPQICMSLYFGGLMGQQRQVAANAITTGLNILRSGLVIVPMYLWPDIRVFFLWQATTSVISTLLLRRTLKHQIQRDHKASHPYTSVPTGRFSLQTLRPIRSYALGMLGMSIIAGLNTQLDKLTISKMLPLQEFAHYSLASTLAQIPYLLTLPIATALLPRFTSLIETGRNSEMSVLYRDSSYYIACIGSIAGMGLFLFAGDVIAVWMHGTAVAPATKLAAQVLAIGSILLTLQLAPFQLSLANGHNSTNVRLGVAVLLISAPLQVALTTRYGMVGTAVPWLVTNGVAFILLGVVLNRRFPVVSVRTWFFADNLSAIVLAAILMSATRAAAERAADGPLERCAIAALGACVTLVVAHRLRRLTRDRAPNFS